MEVVAGISFKLCYTDSSSFMKASMAARVHPCLEINYVNVTMTFQLCGLALPTTKAYLFV